MKNKSQLNSKHEPKEILLSLLNLDHQSSLPISTDASDDNKEQASLYVEPTVRAYNAVMRYKSCINNTIKVG